MQLSREKLTRAYRDMWTIRTFEDRLHRMPKGEIRGTVHLYAGQEACAVGVGMYLGDNEAVEHARAAPEVSLDDLTTDVFLTY